VFVELSVVNRLTFFVAGHIPSYQPGYRRGMDSEEPGSISSRIFTLADHPRDLYDRVNPIITRLCSVAFATPT
jgi:hypothetical protein